MILTHECVWVRVREREDSKINFVFQSLTTISFDLGLAKYETLHL